MAEYQTNLSVTDNDLAEEQSDECLKRILRHQNIKPHFALNDKTANTDGWIELLKDRHVNGNIIVQIKTLPKKYYGKYKYNFPTSILGYAQKCPNEVVFLFAVNCQDNYAYWKHINKSLIELYIDKFSQKTITISFDKNEILNVDNIDAIVDLWQGFHLKHRNLIIQTEKINQENELLKVQLEKYQNPLFSIKKDYVIKLQVFIDRYNYLLDYDYNFIKNIFYPECWKIGVAIFKYTQYEISFILYKIRLGENTLLIREIPVESVKSFFNYTVIFQSIRENSINNDPEEHAFKLVQDKVTELFKKKSVLFLTKETANEYVFDFIKQNSNIVNIKSTDSYDLLSLIQKLENNFPDISKRTFYSVNKGNKSINLKILYECVSYLINCGINHIERLYPQKGQYGNTGLVLSWYTAELAYEKVCFLYNLLPSIFDSYILNVFPLLHNKVTFYDDYDLILVNLNYNNSGIDDFKNTNLSVYYLNLISGKSTLPEIKISLNSLDIFVKNSICDYGKIFLFMGQGETLKYNNNEYHVSKITSEDIHILLGEYYIHNMLYKYLNDRFKEYFKNESNL